MSFATSLAKLKSGAIRSSSKKADAAENAEQTKRSVESELCVGKSDSLDDDELVLQEDESGVKLLRPKICRCRKTLGTFAGIYVRQCSNGEDKNIKARVPVAKKGPKAE